MKLCWDSIEDLRYIGNGKWRKNGSTWIYKESCKRCREPFLTRIQNDSIFCSKSCTFRGKNHPYYGKVGKNSANWKGGYYLKGVPTYDTYAPQLEWCEEVRRNRKDPNILEVKCFKCGEWYTPTLNNVKNRINVLKDTKGYLGENNFYCSDECKNSCSIYHKSAETLMKEDAIRAGRLEWLELDREVQPDLREMVLERDGYQCVKCGRKGRPLHCHHILPVSTNPLESADIDNCITYCIDCHKEAHQQDGCRYNDLKMEVC